MKKIMLVLLVGFVTLWAENQSGLLVNAGIHDDTVAGIIGNDGYFVYKTSDVNISSENAADIKLLKMFNVKNVCESKKLRSVVDLGITIRYIYLEKNGNAVVISIDNCKKYPLKK